MNSPLILATWSFSQKGMIPALETLKAGGDPLDACETVCSAAERDEDVDSVGYGGLPDASGAVSLDAAVMRSPAESGSVCCLREHLDVTRVARLVMEQTPHVMLVGHAADVFASTHGVPEENLLAPGAREKWLLWQRDPRTFDQSRDSGLRPLDNKEDGVGAIFSADLNDEGRWLHHDTIGVLAMQQDGTMAGACSTSGVPFKQPGRVGDSPIIGHGLYVEPGVGMAVGTGEGELLMGICGSFSAVDSMRRGASPLDAGMEVLQRIDANYDLKKHHQIGFITCDAAGRYAAVALREGFRAVVGDQDGVRVIEPDQVLHSGT